MQTIVGMTVHCCCGDDDSLAVEFHIVRPSVVKRLPMRLQSIGPSVCEGLVALRCRFEAESFYPWKKNICVCNGFPYLPPHTTHRDPSMYADNNPCRSNDFM